MLLCFDTNKSREESIQRSAKQGQLLSSGDILHAALDNSNILGVSVITLLPVTLSNMW